jgi:hypothetical protein
MSHAKPTPAEQTAFRALLGQIVEAGGERGLFAKDLAVRAGTTPETLSRMKKRGTGDFTVLDRMARMVGLRLTLAVNHETLDKIQRGEFFDD